MSDPNLNHPAVKLLRDVFRYCPNYGFRKDIVITAEQDMDLWKKVISEWRDRKYNPLNYKGMMQEFELRLRTNGKS